MVGKLKSVFHKWAPWIQKRLNSTGIKAKWLKFGKEMSKSWLRIGTR